MRPKAFFWASPRTFENFLILSPDLGDLKKQKAIGEKMVLENDFFNSIDEKKKKRKEFKGQRG